MTKNQTPTFRPPDIFVPDIASFSGDDSDKKWCPVRTLKLYLARTKRRRDPGSRLFITTTKPFHTAAKDTIARWTVSAIIFANQDWPTHHETTRSHIRAHDVRAASASWSYFREVSLADICQASCWRSISSSTVTECYPKDVLRSETAHGTATLRSVVRTTPNAVPDRTTDPSA